ncbi:MAG: Uncharacterized protein Athens071412_787 [Parcubacteria group bacterium Athens0714_12]|nr:MAG: Uncharacterized protein Athens071412_787 [Parcubacteria group bacterium Athens0714_12]
MIISPHLIVGAAIGAKTNNLGLIIILGLISHLILDKIPHWDYAVFKNLEIFKKSRNLEYLLKPFLKMFIDGFVGLIIVFLLIVFKNIPFNKLLFIGLGIFFSILPDIALIFSNLFIPEKDNTRYFLFHEKYLHSHKEKEGKITFPGLATQILIITISLLLFFF